MTKKLCKISALDKKEGNRRISTQELLQTIYKKIQEGYTNFEIDALGQHDLGGAVWAKELDKDGKRKRLNFLIKNPGQRVGAMALKGTRIVVEGSAPADVGWLNSGAEIIVKGDAGDTASHCAAGGRIYIAGRSGARSGALMKHDPKFDQPEFWVLKNTGSFSFEFMGGGIAVICGWGCEKLNSVLSSRSCVGMVGGTIYIRGKIEDLSSSVEVVKLDKSDENFLKTGIVRFLKNIEKEELYNKLTKFSEWKKIVPKKDKKQKQITLKEFKNKNWFPEGLFGDLVEDNKDVYYLAQAGIGRLRKPVWNKNLCVNCSICLNNCPQNAILKKENDYISDDKKCIGCGICTGVCPKSAWNMIENKP